MRLRRSNDGLASSVATTSAIFRFVTGTLSVIKQLLATFNFNRKNGDAEQDVKQKKTKSEENVDMFANHGHAGRRDARLPQTHAHEVTGKSLLIEFLS